MKENEPAIDEDHEFVSLSKKGDADAFEVLVRKHQKRMFNLAFRMIGNYEEASEIVQDAFISAYKCIKHFEERARFSTWLCKIVINLSRNCLKKLNVQSYREELSLDDPVLLDDGRIAISSASDEPSVLETLEKKDIQQRVQGCIESLESDFREVVILRDIQGFSYEEVGDMLNIPVGTVKSRIFRARSILRECLKGVRGVL